MSVFRDDIWLILGSNTQKRFGLRLLPSFAGFCIPHYRKNRVIKLTLHCKHRHICYHAPMTFFITHQSACEYWRGPYVRRGDRTGWLRALPSGSLAGSSIDEVQLEHRGIHGRPIDVSVADAGQRCQQAAVRVHVLAGSIPAGAFEHLSGDYWVASPELMFCQMAGRLGFPETVKLGFELCARYRINEFTEEPDRREPLTTSRALQDFSGRWKGRNGAKAARAAARYVLGGAESPMEVAVAMLLSLPRMYGGYGLPAPRLNPEITVVSRADSRVRHTYRADLAWPEQRVIAEYDSTLHHSGKRDVIADAQRRNNLQDAGWRVIVLTAQQVRSGAAMDSAAKQLQRALGWHDSSKAPLRLAERRAELRRVVLPKGMETSVLM